MLTRFLANSFAGVIELLMWLFVIFGTLIGIGSGTTANPIIGGIFGFICSLIIAIIFFGPIMLILDLKNSVSNIETMLRNKSHD